MEVNSASLRQFIKKKKTQESQALMIEHMDPSQKFVERLLSSMACEVVLTLLVSLSVVLMVMEADHHNEVPEWIDQSENILLGIYVFEITLRIFVYRWLFFSSVFNLLDLGIVCLELLFHLVILIIPSGGEGVPSVSAFRFIRLFRLLRGMKVIMKFPQLALIVKGLISAFSAAFYGLVLLLLMLTVWSVFAVHMIDPINQRLTEKGTYAGCERCPGAFSSVRASMITFTQQIIAGDSWGTVTIPIMEESPSTVIFFALVFVTVSFSLMNVILAAIVDSALKASQEDITELLKQKQKAISEAQQFLTSICREMDENGSGDLTESELRHGFQHHREFHDILTSMDISEEDMTVVFHILDTDDSNKVDYEEFVSELFKMKQHDPHTMLVFIKHIATETRKDVREHLNLAKKTKRDSFHGVEPQANNPLVRRDQDFHFNCRPPQDVGELLEQLEQDLHARLHELTRQLQLAQPLEAKLPHDGPRPRIQPRQELKWAKQSNSPHLATTAKSGFCSPRSVWGVASCCEPTKPRLQTDHFSSGAQRSEWQDAAQGTDRVCRSVSPSK